MNRSSVGNVSILKTVFPRYSLQNLFTGCTETEEKISLKCAVSNPSTVNRRYLVMFLIKFNIVYFSTNVQNLDF